MPMSNKPQVNHRLLPHTPMSMRDKSVIDESHPMIILKAKVICSLNQNFWMSYSNDLFFYKTVSFMGSDCSGSHWRLCKPSYNFTGFHRLKRINHIYRVFHLKGTYPCFLLPDTYFNFYVCNRATLLNVVQRYRVHQSITKHSVDSYHTLPLMSCDVYVHNSMRYATTCLCHAAYVMNARWTTQTTQFIMCHGKLY